MIDIIDTGMIYYSLYKYLYLLFDLYSSY